jgi:hypothetical protein
MAAGLMAAIIVASVLQSLKLGKSSDLRFFFRYVLPVVLLAFCSGSYLLVKGARKNSK